MRRKWITLFGALACFGGDALAQGFGGRYDASPPPAMVAAGGIPVWEQRVLYNTVQLKGGQRAACEGRRPVVIRAQRTVGDVSAAIVTLGLWTPVHLHVIC